MNAPEPTKPEDWRLWANGTLEGLHISSDGWTMIYPFFDRYFMWLAMGPAFGNVSLQTLERVDPTLKDKWYDREWRWVYDHRSQITGGIVIWTWNQYVERTFIEPVKYDPLIPPGKYLLKKTRYYYDIVITGKPFETYLGDDETASWVSVEDLKNVIGPIRYDELGFGSTGEPDNFLQRIIERAQSYVEKYIGKKFAIKSQQVAYLTDRVSAGSTEILVSDVSNHGEL